MAITIAATRRRGSRRLDPNALQVAMTEIPFDRPIYLYCTCVREATSARVAQDLLGEGVEWRRDSRRTARLEESWSAHGARSA